MKLEPWLYFIGLLCVGIYLSVLTAGYGAVPHAVFGHDTPLFYDAGWRVYYGLRPHVDFYSPFGPVLYLYVALGYLLFGVNADSLASINALSLLFLLGLTWFSLQGRMAGFWLFWISLLVGLCFMAPHPLRFPFWMSSYAMLYNRQGYAWLMLLAMLLFSPCGTASPGRFKADSFLIGCILAILFFLKISFFITGAAMLACFFVMERCFPLSLPFLLSGLGVIVLPMLAYLKFDVSAMLGDLCITANAKDITMENTQMQMVLLGMIKPILIATLMLLLGAAYPAWNSHDYKMSKVLLGQIILFVLFVICSVFQAVTDSYLGNINDHPLLAAFGILMVVRTGGNGVSTTTWQVPSLRFKALFVVSLIYAGSYIVGDARSIVYQPAIPITLPRLESDTMDGLIMFPDSAGPYNVEKNNDGLRLIRRNGVADKCVISLDFTSIFAVALHSPPYGGAIYWNSGSDFSVASHPAATKIFDRVDYLMVPLHPEQPTSFADFSTCYGDYIQSNFQFVDQSNEWVLMKRR